jgi:hypothetical protein
MRILEWPFRSHISRRAGHRGQPWRRQVMLVLMFVLISAVTILAQNPTPSFSYQTYDEITRTYVNDQGLVDYKNLKANLNKLKDFTDLLAAVGPDNHPELFADAEEKKRYYLTAYNAWVMYHATQAYPDKHHLWSRLGYFKNKDIVLGGTKLSLNTLEHQIIRKQFLDPRIHFYINCGAKGCPRVRQGAIGEKLTEQALEQAAKDFLQDPQNFRVDSATRTVYLSKIFDWFAEDFIRYLQTQRGLAKPHIAQYVLPYIGETDRSTLANIPLDQLKVKYLSYDKELNEQ